MKYFVYLFVFSLTSCKLSSGTAGMVAETSSVPGKVYCAVPKEKDFEKVVDPTGREAALSQVLDGKVFSQVKKILNIPNGQEKIWLLKAITPLGMGCSSFFNKDITAYGQDSYVNFANLVLTMYLSPDEGGIQPLPRPRGAFSLDDTRDPKKYPMIATLRAINSLVAIADKGPNGRELKPGEIIYTNPKGELRDGNRIDKNELNDEQIEQLKENIEGEHILGMFENKKEQEVKDDAGTITKIPVGTYLAYPAFSEVKNLLKKANDEFVAATKNSNEKNLVDAAANLMRRCVSIHPFGDGNGRTCTLIGVWVLAQKKIPHAVIWAGDDVLLKNSVWIDRYREGAAFHKALLLSR
jgi:hypothetical protein